MIEAKGVNGQVAFDGQFVTITRKGFLARATVGKGEKRIPVKSLTAVQWKPATALVRGFIQFTFAGGNERRSKFGSQTEDAGRDENSVVFAKAQQEDFEKLRVSVETAIGDGSAMPAATDMADQIKKLSDLRDSGVLTEDEFAAKKADLLSRM